MTEMFDTRGCLTTPLTDTNDMWRDLGAFYRQLLTEDLLPWWLEHGLGRESGGICSCIQDDGTIVNRDKFVWSQLRALWTFAGACNRIGDQPDWHEAADHMFRFISGNNQQHASGRWNFLTSCDGEVKKGFESIQCDAFAICGLAEYYRLSGEESARTMGLRTANAVLEALAVPGSYGTAPYPIPEGTKAQRVAMQHSLALAEAGKAFNDEALLAESRKLTDDILDNFRIPERQAILEYVALDNSLLPAPTGTYMGPGHGIETAWFQIENLRGTDIENLPEILDIMRWSFEKGWDTEYGGLFLGIDIDGGEPLFEHSEKKIWWPHCEALCGTLLAYEVSGEQWCLDWYTKSHNYAFDKFPDREHGEWTQRLDRKGNRHADYIILPVKDPFHLPRAAIYAVEICQRLASRTTPL